MRPKLKINLFIFLTIVSINLTLNYAIAYARTVFLQIDTIQLSNAINDASNFNISLIEPLPSCISSLFHIAGTLSFNKAPNYTASFSCERRLSYLRIPIDLKGSYVVVKIPPYTDTIRINRLRLFETQPPEITQTTIVKYKKVSGEIQFPPFKIKRKTSEKRAKEPLQTIELIINGIIYKCTLEFVDAELVEVCHGHGYKPHNPYKKDGSDKRRTTYIYIEILTYRSYWKAEIELKRSLLSN